MNNRLPLILLISLGAVLYFFFIRFEQKDQRQKIGRELPNFSLTSLDGQKLETASLKGKVVLVHFWATWCPPCVNEIPELNKFYNSMRASAQDDFVLIALSVDADPKDVEDFKKRAQFDFPVYFDASEKMADFFGTYGLPESYFVDRQQKIHDQFIGPQDWGLPQWKSIYEKL